MHHSCMLLSVAQHVDFFLQAEVFSELTKVAILTDCFSLASNFMQVLQSEGTFAGNICVLCTDTGCLIVCHILKIEFRRLRKHIWKSIAAKYFLSQKATLYFVKRNVQSCYKKSLQGVLQVSLVQLIQTTLSNCFRHVSDEKITLHTTFWCKKINEITNKIG